MKRSLKSLSALLLVSALTFTSCKKSINEEQAAVSQETLTKIQAKGFGTSTVEKIEEGYLVEGDIVLTNEYLNGGQPGNILRVGSVEQYRTTNLVSAGSGRTITVALDSKLNSKAGYPQALTELVNRYNAQNLLLKFQVVSSGANITFVNSNGQYLASAGFPTSGNPYGTVKVNSRAIGSGTSTTFVNYLATIISHETGHCIGFRHTDYMDRSYSCGGATSNEGASSVGAILIPGTPASADPNSWMLACIGSGVNRPFNANDRTALAWLY